MNGSKHWYIYIMECNAVERKKELSMDGIGEPYDKSNKPGGERQIPYDLIYGWNLINKPNK